MTTAIILIVILGGGSIWLYRLGRMSKDADRLDGHKKVMGSVNEFNRKEDERVDKALDNITVNRVGVPWLRRRK